MLREHIHMKTIPFFPISSTLIFLLHRDRLSPLSCAVPMLFSHRQSSCPPGPHPTYFPLVRAHCDNKRLTVKLSFIFLHCLLMCGTKVRRQALGTREVAFFIVFTMDTSIYQNCCNSIILMRCSSCPEHQFASTRTHEHSARPVIHTVCGLKRFLRPFSNILGWNTNTNAVSALFGTLCRKFYVSVICSHQLPPALVPVSVYSGSNFCGWDNVHNPDE